MPALALHAHAHADTAFSKFKFNLCHEKMLRREVVGLARSRGALLRLLCSAAAPAYGGAATSPLRLPPGATLAQALACATRAFEDAHVPEATLSAEHLLAGASGIGARSQLLLAGRS